MPIFFSCAPRDTPGSFMSTTNMEIPLLPLAVRSVLANTTAQSAMGAPEMKHLRPLMMKSSPSAMAVVVVPPASEPAPGSVRPNTMIFSPLATAGRYFCF